MIWVLLFYRKETASDFDLQRERKTCRVVLIKSVKGAIVV